MAKGLEEGMTKTSRNGQVDLEDGSKSESRQAGTHHANLLGLDLLARVAGRTLRIMLVVMLTCRWSQGESRSGIQSHGRTSFSGSAPFKSRHYNHVGYGFKTDGGLNADRRSPWAVRQPDTQKLLCLL